MKLNVLKKPTSGTKTQRLQGYMATSLGLGACASSADAAMVVLDLSTISTPPSVFIALPSGDGTDDFGFNSANSAYGYFLKLGSASFYSTNAGSNNNSSPGYQQGPVSFGGTPREFAMWTGYGNSPNGFATGGNNWVAFKDTDNRYCWLNFSLDDPSLTNDTVDVQLLHFVYDDMATSIATAPNLSQAIAAIPEPSSLSLLALGAVGIAARRERKKKA